MSQSERFVLLESKREEVLAELEDALLDEWDVASAVHAPPPRPPIVIGEAPAAPPPVISDNTKRNITLVALTIGGAIAAALKAMQ